MVREIERITEGRDAAGNVVRIEWLSPGIAWGNVIMVTKDQPFRLNGKSCTERQALAALSSIVGPITESWPT